MFLILLVDEQLKQMIKFLKPVETSFGESNRPWDLLGWAITHNYRAEPGWLEHQNLWVLLYVAVYLPKTKLFPSNVRTDLYN